MKKRIIIALAALGLAVTGLVVGPAGAALAESNWAYPVYDEHGNYAGCISKFTGNFSNPSEITELGCNTDIPLSE